MKYFAILCLFVSILACGNSTNTSGEENVVQADSIESTTSRLVFLKDSLVNNPEFSYFIPETVNDSMPVICIVFFDPQGNGQRPVSQYQNLATQYGFALFGSNESKNGMTSGQTRPIASALVSGIESGFHKRPVFYFAGFSGGAKVALDAGMAIAEVKAVLYTGAPGFAPTVSKPVFGFAGTADMNYADLLAYDQSLSEQPAHFLWEWGGKHEWPERSVFLNALTWIALREKQSGFGFSTVSSSIEKQSKREKDPVRKERWLSFAAFLANETGNKFQGEKELDEIRGGGGFREAMLKKQDVLKMELQLKAFYGQAFMEKDLNWWEYEIAKLKSSKDTDDSALNDRLLGYFSLAAFSISNRSLAANELELANKILRIYQLSDPGNSEQAYLRAVFMAKSGNQSGIAGCLNEAIELGFKEKSRILNEAAFQQFLQGKQLQEMLVKIP